MSALAAPYRVVWKRLSGGDFQTELLMLKVELLDHIHDQIGWVFSPLFDKQHLNQMTLRQKKNNLSILAKNAVTLDKGGTVGHLITAHDRKPTHWLGKIVSCLIRFVFTDFFLIVILELKEYHPCIKFLIQIPQLLGA